MADQNRRTRRTRQGDWRQGTSKFLDGRKLAAWRLLRGLSLTELAVASGFGSDAGRIRHYEDGDWGASMASIRAMAAALECDVTDLYLPKLLAVINGGQAPAPAREEREPARKVA